MPVAITAVAATMAERAVKVGSSLSRLTFRFHDSVK